MSALLKRADQAVSVTDFSRSAKQYFDRLKSGEQDRYVVMRNNAPAAVMLPVAEYEQLIDELDDLKVELIAAQRLTQLSENTETISFEDMRSRYK